MSVTIECPTCTRRVKVPPEASGKKVKCPGCEGYMTVPKLAEEFEVVPERKKPESRSKLFDDDDNDVRPRRRSRSRLDDDDGEDERPRRSRRRDDADDDDEDRRPRRGGMNPQTRTLLIYGGGGLAAVLLLVGLMAIFGVFSSKKGSSGTAASSSAPPPGWSRVDDADFVCFLPGNPSQISRGGNPADGSALNKAWQTQMPSSGTRFWVIPLKYTDQTVGTTETFLMEEAGRQTWTALRTNRNGPASEIVKQTMITAAGRPCLELTFQDPDTFGAMKPFQPMNRPPLPDNMPANIRANMEENHRRSEDAYRRSYEERQDRFLKSRRHGVARIIADGKRSFILVVESNGKDPEPDLVKTFFESFDPK